MCCFFCEHPPVITLGRNGKRENLLASEHVLKQKSVEFYESDRGGDITYHGPGQIVGYPIIDLGAIRRDVHWYVRMLEEVMIRASAEFGISAFRVAGKTGIWVESGATEEKLAAIGVHLSRWVTSHGFAYNVATDLRNFELIVPCGIANRKATSLEKLLERRVQKDEVAPKTCPKFCCGLWVRTRGSGPRGISGAIATRRTRGAGFSIGNKFLHRYGRNRSTNEAGHQQTATPGPVLLHAA